MAKYSAYLDAFFLEVDFEGELLPEDDVRVVRFLKGGLQLLELLLGENGAVASLSLGRRRPGGPVHAPVAQTARGRVSSGRRDSRVVVAGVKALVGHSWNNKITINL